MSKCVNVLTIPLQDFLVTRATESSWFPKCQTARAVSGSVCVYTKLCLSMAKLLAVDRRSWVF